MSGGICSGEMVGREYVSQSVFEVLNIDGEATPNVDFRKLFSHLCISPFIPRILNNFLDGFVIDTNF